jgi:acetoin utilization deacetylase AcuC-like enzyme
MIGFCTSPEFVRHLTGPGHPERPDRLAAIFQAVRIARLIDSPNPLAPVVNEFGPVARSGFVLHELSPTPAEPRWIETVHSPAYLESIEKTCATCGFLDGGDTVVCPDSFQTALLSTGAVLSCCDAVMAGQVRRAFAAIRPPGHHAEPGRAMGFCLFANVAIAARYLQRQHGIGRVAIVDFDVHHGNGTQAAFQSDLSVLFISLHQHPDTCYPGTGYDWEIGIGPGRGFTLNIPLQPGGGDEVYIPAFDDRVLPRLDQFKPDILLLSAGFDAHRDDPLASMQMSDEGFAQITKKLVTFADSRCAGRIVSALEGGYDLRALGRSVVKHLIELGD